MQKMQNAPTEAGHTSIKQAMQRIKIGIIGLGRMGCKHLREFAACEYWDVKYTCDINPEKITSSQEIAPDAIFTTDEHDIFNDPEVQCVGLFTLADTRATHIEKALKTGKHIYCEKPIADNLQDEWKIVQLEESTNKICTVNLFLRNSWYAATMKDFALSGEIGELAIIRICHMAPGLSPGEGHEYEGPSFHDCGMHYIDICRWFADSEYKTGHAQAVRMWNYKDPWWLQCHGTFENGIVYDVTQGFVYGQLAKDQTHNSYMELIGSKGFVRMKHDFKTAVVEMHGEHITDRIEKAYGDKNIDRLCQLMGEAILTGKRPNSLPRFRDAAIASEYAWKMLDDATHNDLPSKGTPLELEQIHYRRAHAANGYGLLKHSKH